MKHLAVLPALLAALPAFAHQAGPVVHAHPHGMEAIAAGVIGLCVLAFVAWKARGRF
jgi:hypothetical protein